MVDAVEFCAGTLPMSELREIWKNLRLVLYRLGRRDRTNLLLALGVIGLTAALTNALPLLLGAMVDRATGAQGVTFRMAVPFLTAIFAIVIAREGLHVLRKCLVESTCTRIEMETRVAAISHLLRLDFTFFSDSQSGALHGRLNRSTEGLVKMVKLGFLDLGPAVLVALFALVAALLKSPIVAFVMALFMPIGLRIILSQIRSQKGIRLDLLRGKEEMDGAIVEMLGGIESIRAMDTAGIEAARIGSISDKLRRKELRHHLWMAWFDSFKGLNEGVSHIVVLGTAVGLATIGSITTGDVLTVSLLFAAVTAPLREVHRILDEAHESSLKIQDLNSLFDLPIAEPFRVQTSGVCASQRGCGQGIEVTTLCHRHRGAPAATLNNVSFKIAPGEFVGICGPAGCGKSTMAKIFLRLLSPTGGHVKMFGLCLDYLSQADIAASVVYVSQTPLVFSGSVRENIAYGLKGVTEDDIRRAATLANIHGEIMSMPNGYDTQVGERGAKLSGGQRQRLAIARIFLRRPRVIILDEATSALDNINEQAVTKAIRENLGRETIIIAIAHRLTTLKSADRILVFQHGELVEQGDYPSLAEKGGLFGVMLKSAA
jgi:ATP-binding cassette subfamily B protein